MAFKAFHKLLFLSLFLTTSFFYFGQSGITIVDSISSGGMNRKFRLYVPAAYNPNTAVPLIFNLHGYTSNAFQQQVYSDFMPIADTADFLMVYPDGTAPFGSPFWNAGIVASPDDVLFISDLLDSLRLSYNIDITRVYSCGMSNGAIMSYYLACSLPNRITAIASVAGTMFKNWYGSCNPGRPVPVMEIHGTGDATVPYPGDASTFTAVDSVIRQWVSYNNCNPTPATFSVANTNTTDNTTAVNYRYTGGTAGSSVELYKIANGSHSWPGAAPVFSNTNEDFNASVEIWRFFRQYRLSQFISNVGIQENSPLENLLIFPNPTAGLVTLRGAADASYAVHSMDGKQLMAGEAASTIDLQALPAGIYILRISKNNFSRSFKLARN